MCFRFVGQNLNLETISATLNILNAVTYRAGEKPGSLAPNYWLINSSLEVRENLEDHICSLLTVLLPKEKEIRQLAAEFGSPSFFCTVASDNEDDDETSSYVANLHSETIQGIARLDAHLFLSLSA